MSFSLSNYGVLGLNARNLLYIKPFNPRKAVAFADDKMKTKAFLSARDIPVAKVYARIETRQQLRSFDFSALPDECVLKPNYGFGGEGIIILRGRKNGVFMRQGKHPMTNQELTEHIEDILDGKFSVNGRADTAFFEKILETDESFRLFQPAGLPDIRVIVFNLVPVMAMLRVPTAKSGGKANLHLGGLGIGIDMASGMTTYGSQYNRIITELPNGGPIAGHQIPYWEQILLISSKIQYHTNIGYLAVDLTIDREMGPALLEVNARAGLSVQIANLAPLRARLEKVAGITVSTPEKGVRLAQELFGLKSKKSAPKKKEEERPILGTRDAVEFQGDGFSMEEPCLISPDENETVFTLDLVDLLKKKNVLEHEEGTTGVYRVKFGLGGKKITTLVHTGALPAGYRVRIGKRDLSGFLIDPSRNPVQSPARTASKKNLLAVDRVLADIDRQMALLKYLRPTNIKDELPRLREDKTYNPLFQYAPLPFDIADIERKLVNLSIDDSPLGVLLSKKRRELVAKLDLLSSRGRAVRFSTASQAVYGAATPSLVTAARQYIAVRSACDLPPKELYTAQAAVPFFEQSLESYGLHEWQVKLKTNLVADCAVGHKNVYLREGALFSREHLESLVAHEIETHALTAENALFQPVMLLKQGMANYLDTQEGLAIWNQNRVLSPHHNKRYLHAYAVLACAYALEHSFAETRKYLEDTLDYEKEKALMKTIELKRGIGNTNEPGAFTKTLVYHRGYRAIEQFVHAGGDIKKLYLGKVAVEDLPLLDQVSGVKAPLLLPLFLREKKEKVSGKGRKKPKGAKKDALAAGETQE